MSDRGREMLTAAGWGAQEHAARLKDIADVKAGLMSIQDAQQRARQRQSAAGLSHFQASTAVSDHSREMRREEAARAGRIALTQEPKQ